VFEAAIRVKSTYLIKSCLKTIKKENEQIKYILHKSPSKRSFRHRPRIHSLLRAGELMPEEALTSFSLPYLTHIAIVCGSGIVIEVRK